jgi:hypothetical protein
MKVLTGKGEGLWDWALAGAADARPNQVATNASRAMRAMPLLAMAFSPKR